MLERGFRVRMLEGLCDVGLVVELELGLRNRRGGERVEEKGVSAMLRLERETKRSSSAMGFVEI
jgi:hypothetical protein